AKEIETLFKPSAAGPQLSPQQRQIQMQQGIQQPPGADTGSQRHGTSVVAVADDRTNTLMIMASSDTLKLIDNVIKQLDSDNPNPAPPTEVRSYILKFAHAVATAKL